MNRTANWNNPVRLRKARSRRTPADVKCPKCNTPMNLSNLDETKLICHGCNHTMFKEEV